MTKQITTTIEVAPLGGYVLYAIEGEGDQHIARMLTARTTLDEIVADQRRHIEAHSRPSIERGDPLPKGIWPVEPLPRTPDDQDAPLSWRFGLFRRAAA